MRRFSGIPIVVVSTVCLFLMAAANSFAQSPVGGEGWLSRSESAAYQPTAEALSVRATLDQFDSALALHDAAGLRAVGVNRGRAKLWRRFFRNNPEATVTDDCPVSELAISHKRASWRCMETVTIISENKPRTFLHTIQFTFAKRGGTWMVAKRR